jgi:lipopolysaccharide heptosyltransferase II
VDAQQPGIEQLKDALAQDPNQRRILISRLSAHGDVVQTLPVLAAIKAHWPDAHVGWVVEASAAPLLEKCPLIDTLHVSRRKQWQADLSQPRQWLATSREVHGFIGEIREQGYTVSLDVQGLLKSAVIPWLAGIPNRLGFRATRESADRFYTHRLAPIGQRDAHTSATDQFLALSDALGCPHPRRFGYPLPPVEDVVMEWMAAVTGRRYQLESGLLTEIDVPVIALAPATIWPSKHWPPANWQQLIDELLGRNYRVLLIGSPNEQPLADALVKPYRRPDGTLPGNIRNLVAHTSLPDLYALFRCVDVLIGPDSAPLHIANAVAAQPDNEAQRPHIIGLYGPTAPGRTGPFAGPEGPRHESLSASLACQPCFERKCPRKTDKDACMRLLTPDQVMANIEAYLALNFPRLAQPAKIIGRMA